MKMNCGTSLILVSLPLLTCKKEISLTVMWMPSIFISSLININFFRLVRLLTRWKTGQILTTRRNLKRILLILGWHCWMRRILVILGRRSKKTSTNALSTTTTLGWNSSQTYSNQTQHSVQIAEHYSNNPFSIWTHIKKQ
jgi:hypothetical protein